MSRFPRLLDGLTPEQITRLLIERREALARRAADLHAQNQSLRETAKILGVSHESVRKLLSEVKGDQAEE